jgi:deoxycytidylate deaminase
MTDYLARAFHAATQSPDPSTQVGAIAVTADGYIVGAGWNHIPRSSGVDHATVDRETKYRCVVHAEVAALISATELVHTLYGTWLACEQCAAAIITAGVRRVVRAGVITSAPSRTATWLESVAAGDEMMRSAGIEIVTVEGPIAAPAILIGGVLVDPSC